MADDEGYEELDMGFDPNALRQDVKVSL